MKINAADAGCWIEGSRGRYAMSRLVEIALSHPGFLRRSNRAGTMAARTEARHILRAYDAGEDTASYRRRPKYGRSYVIEIKDVFEQVVGLADDAEEFLNTIAPEGYSFGWEGGEFFLMRDDWWDDLAC